MYRTGSPAATPPGAWYWGLFLALSVLAINVVDDGLRDLLNVR